MNQLFERFVLSFLRRHASQIFPAPFNDLHIVAQTSVNPSSDDAPDWQPFRTGSFVRGGLRYNLRYLQLWLILLWVDDLKHQSDPQGQVENASQMQRTLDDLLDRIPARQDRAYDMLLRRCVSFA